MAEEDVSTRGQYVSGAKSQHIIETSQYISGYYWQKSVYLRVGVAEVRVTVTSGKSQAEVSVTRGGYAHRLWVNQYNRKARL